MNLALVIPESQQVWTKHGIKTYAQLGLPHDVKKWAIIDHLQSFGYDVIFETI